jgi:hypothetical protein
MFCIGLGTAVPPDRYTQRECFDALQSSPLFESLQPRSRAILRKVLLGVSRIAVARQCDAGFARRLRWARWLQWILLHRSSRGALLALGDRCDWLWRAWFHQTR